MEDDNKQLSELKTIYDELWSDAKTLFKDMKKSIVIYLYAGFVTLIVAVSAIVNAIPYFLLILLGKGNLFDWSFVIIEIVAAVVVVSFAAKLLMWYKGLKRRYARLIHMEKSLGDK